MTYRSLKAWLYPVTSLVAGGVCFLALHLALHMDIVYSVFYAVFAAAVTFLLVRLIVHLVYKDTDDRWKATMIWGVIATGMFLWLILNTHRDIQTVLIFAVLVSTINFCGFRWIAKSETATAAVSEMSAAIEVKTETRAEKIERLASTLKYRYLEDGKTPNLDAPLCLVDGVAVTPKQADERGYGALYANAIEYIKTLV